MTVLESLAAANPLAGPEKKRKEKTPCGTILALTLVPAMLIA